MKYYPMKLQPCYKEYLWGGTKLKTEYGKLDAPQVCAESWELSCHPDGMSYVQNGCHANKSLKQVIDGDTAGMLGVKYQGNRFPFLVKLIDAEKDLSVQVHPADETANVAEGEQGKAEMWYIVDAKPQSFLYLGFSVRIEEAELRKRAEDGTICEVLNKVPVKSGDVFYILPGIIHAVGAGVTIAEIQQNSNTTFRVYDYRRKDSSGNLRPLHIERAASVMSFEPIVPGECRGKTVAIFSEFTLTEMFSCKYFRAYKLDIQSAATLSTGGDTFHYFLCVDGEGCITCDGVSYPFRRGDSYFLPAGLGEYTVHGACRALLSRE